MNETEFLTKIDQLTIWKNGDVRAPNKPLMLLLALSQLHNFDKQQLLYEEADPLLTELLEEFGPPRKGYKTNDPFWRLEGDGIWETTAPPIIRPQSGGGNINKSDLIRHKVTGGFSHEVLHLFKHNPFLIHQTAQLILDRHFPTTYHDDILAALGLGLEETITSTRRRRKRDPAFREAVLSAYGYACAVCGFQVMLAKKHLALEAAHIKWHQAKGPDHVSNGLALCSLHHELLDRGAFTVNPYGLIEVSEKAEGNAGFDSWLGKFHHQPLEKPLDSVQEPAPEYLLWHRKQVFKGQPPG